MTAEEEAALAAASDGGDQTAYKKLIVANLRLVVPISHRYAGRSMRFPDLMQKGNIGLVRAAELFDSEEDRPFSKVARQYIEEAVSAAAG